MGPRLFSRGNYQNIGRWFLHFSASMGPRLFSRGNDFIKLTSDLLLFVLQWGRDSSVAEMTTRKDGVSADGKASMGPRLFSRGNCHSGTHRRFPDTRFNGAATLQSRKWSLGKVLRSYTDECFNGAATLQSRKWPPREGAPSKAGKLQWGRDSSVAEIENQPRNGVPLDKGFNGAATLQSRKCFPASLERRKRGVASMGPRLFSRGNEAIEAAIEDGEAALMGPRLFSRGNKQGPPTIERSLGASMGPRLFSRGNAAGI